MIRVAAACARHRVPLTVRGGGTGNYGQAVPLAGRGRARHGRARPRRLGEARRRAVRGRGAAPRHRQGVARRTGWELRFHPSTRKQATIGGFTAGGAAGCGSCTWGQNADPGAVIAVEVVTVEETPRLIELKGRDILKVLHAYGVNGIITEVEVPLAPWQPWAERVAAFPTLAAAARFGFALTAAEGIAKKEIGIFDRRIPPMLKRLAPLVPAGECHGDRDGRASRRRRRSPRWSPSMAARIVYERSAAEAEAAAFEGKGTMPPLYEYTWNHTTLHALKVEPDITYLQVRFPERGELALVEAMEQAFGDELLLHLEFQRRFGRVFVSGLPLLRYRSPSALDEVVAADRGDGRGGLEPAYLRARQCRLEAHRRAAGGVQGDGRSARPDEPGKAQGLGRAAAG